MLESECVADGACVNGLIRHVTVGGSGTGKTGRLVARAATLVGEGTDPAQIIVFCASPVARDELRRRLADELAARGLAQKAESLAITTMREFALGLLGSDAARAFTRRDARILTGYETNVMLEDLKTCGVRPGRLKEMLKFFYRGWTELADDDPTWLCLEEEQEVHSLLMACLAGMRGMLEPEVSNLAVRYLRSDAAARAAVTRAHVLVDDYQALSRASQQLARMVCGDELWVAGDEDASMQVFESYPYAAGLAELAAQADEVVRLDVTAGEGGLPAALRGAIHGAEQAEAEADRLAALDKAGEEARRNGASGADGEKADAESGSAAETGGSVENAQVDGSRFVGSDEKAGADADPAVGSHVSSDRERFAAVRQSSDARTVSAMRAPDSTGATVPDGGASHAYEGALAIETLPGPEDEAALVISRVKNALGCGIAADQIYVVAPSRTWASRYERLLAAEGIPVARCYQEHGFGGDVRDLSRCAPARVLTLLRLARGDDASAWRCWCGFGDWLLNSPAFCAARRLGFDGGRLAPALDGLMAGARVNGITAGERIDEVFGERLQADERASLERVYQAFEQGRAFVGELAGLDGIDVVQKASDLVQGVAGSRIPAAVLDALGLHACGDGVAACAGLGQAASSTGDADAGLDALLAGASARLAGLCGFSDDQGVRVGLLEDVVGAKPQLLVLCGMVNGFSPAHAYFDEVMTSPERRERMRARELRRLYATLGCAAGDVLVTSFTGIEAEKAQALGLKVDRYRAQDGKRMARVSPSVILEDLAR